MNWFAHTLLVGAGGFIGANFRYWIGACVLATKPGAFPWSTFAVNLLGSFAIGVFMAQLIKQADNEPMRLFVVVGVLGGFTTMSAFSYETIALLRQQEMTQAAAYVFGSVVFCLLACWAGMAAVGRAT